MDCWLAGATSPATPVRTASCAKSRNAGSRAKPRAPPPPLLPTRVCNRALTMSGRSRLRFASRVSSFASRGKPDPTEKLNERSGGLRRALFLGRVAAIEGLTSNVRRDRAPGGEHVIELPNNTSRPPQRQQRHRELPPRTLIDGVVLEVDRSGSPIILANRMDATRQPVAPQVFLDQRLAGHTLSLALRNQVGAQEEFGVALDESLG